MAAFKIPESVLVVSDNEKNLNMYREMSTVSCDLVFAKDIKEALCIVKMRSFDVILIDLFCDIYEESVVEIFEKTKSKILMLVKSKSFDMISKKLDFDRITVLSKPISVHTVFQALCLITTEKTTVTQEKIEEIKIITHAKCILMEYLKMSENQAHKFIEKQAMDMRITKKEIAENILKTYKS